MPTPAKVLVVDDNQHIQQLLVETLQETGYQGAGSSSGAAALERLKSEKFDLVVTDLVMPEMNGLSLLLEIRKNYPDLPVVIITGYAFENIAREAEEAGAAAFLAKPFRISKIEKVVEEALGKKKESVAVLVVDDDPHFLEFLGDSLKSKGYAPLKAQSFEEALALMKTHPVRFAVVDIGLPGSSGIELARRLKAENPHLPVVLVTGRSLLDMEEALGDDQIDMLLKKPIPLEELYQAIEAVNPNFSLDG